MFEVAKNGRAKVAQKRLPDALAGRGVERSRGIDGVPLHFFAGRWLFLFSLDKTLDDRIILDLQENVLGTNVYAE